MQGWHDTTQLILQILSNPVLGGLGSICSLIALPLSVFLSRQSKITPSNSASNKKNLNST